MKHVGYHQKVKKQNLILLQDKLTRLPTFLKEYFRSIDDSTSSFTRLGYATDLKLFFDFLTQQSQKFMDVEIRKFSLEDLERVEPEDIEDFMDYMTFYIIGRKTKFKGTIDREEENEAAAKARKLSAIRAMYSFFYRREKIKKFPTELVRLPKIPSKPIIRLESYEVVKLLEQAEEGDSLTEGEKRFHEATKTRDVAILTLLLGTGMRVSECVGLDIDHVDFEEGQLRITRKGGNEAVLYFNDEVSNALANYLDERDKVDVEEEDEKALFLSIRKKRISVRAIENLVKKYAKHASPLKRITPHKLRSTFGTSLYNETGDIFLVAEMLGHSSVETTRKHYVAMDDARVRNAAKSIVLRDKTAKK